MKIRKSSSLWNQFDNSNGYKNKNVEVLENGNYKIRFESKKFIIFQSTICTSAKLEKSSNFLIDSSSNLYINNNGEGWSNESLLNNYKSFIGANLCMDHPSTPDIDNVGVILDAVLRKKWIDQKIGSFVYYVDILCALDKNSKGGKIAKLVLDGSMQYQSMGCDVKYSFCSRCGHRVDYENSSSYNSASLECQHLKYAKGRKFLDSNGAERITAELLGKEKGSVTFVEASLLTNHPASKAAILSRIFPITSKSEVIEIEIPKDAIEKAAVQKYLIS